MALKTLRGQTDRHDWTRLIRSYSSLLVRDVMVLGIVARNPLILIVSTSWMFVWVIQPPETSRRRYPVARDLSYLNRIPNLIIMNLSQRAYRVFVVQPITKGSLAVVSSPVSA